MRFDRLYMEILKEMLRKIKGSQISMENIIQAKHSRILPMAKGLQICEDHF